MSNSINKINVLASIYVLDKNDVGGANILYEWVMRLADHVNLTVITTGAKLHEKCGLEDRNDIKLIKLPPKISFKKWDVFDRIVHPGYIEFFFRARKLVNKLVKEGSYDLCQHFSPQSIRWPCPFIDVDIPFLAGPFSGGLKTPKVMNELEGKEEWMVKLRVLDDFRLKYDPWLRKHYSKVARLIVMADYLKDVLAPAVKDQRKYVIIPQPPTKLPNVNEVINHVKKKNNDDVNLIFVGRIVPRKGLELLIEAIDRVKNKNIKLSIYGKGEYEQLYKDMTEKKGLGDKIKWMGFMPNDKIHDAMLESDIFIFPSLKEPTGIVLSEAMGLGLPVICVDYGGCAYVVNDDCGIKIPLGTKEQMVADLAKAIDYLADNPKLRETMRMACIERINKYFSWDAVVRKTLEVYGEVFKEYKEAAKK